MSFKAVKELRLVGKLEQAMDLAKLDLEQDMDNIWNKRSIALVYYEYLKQYTVVNKTDDFLDILNKISALELPVNESMIFDNCAWQIGKLIFAYSHEQQPDYSKLDTLLKYIQTFSFTKPSDQYSYLYKAFHKLYKIRPNYLQFADWWDFNNFHSKDFLQEEFKGKKIMSIVEQAYIAYSKKLLEGETVQRDGTLMSNVLNREKISAFLPELEKIIEQHPDYQYPPYFKAKLLIGIGDKENVLSAFLPFAKQNQNNFWVWDLLAEIYSEENDMCFACYCKALSLKASEDFLVKLHQKLASLLVDRRMYAEAKTEIRELAKVRLKHKWSIPNQVKQWAMTDWFKQTDHKSDNKDLYLKYSKRAEEILFQDLPEEIIAVEFVNENRSILNFVKDRNKHGFFNYSNLIAKPIIGNVLKVRFTEEGQDGFFRILSAKILDSTHKSEAIKEFKGVLRIISPQGFGFVDEVFLDSKMIDKNQLQNNQKIEGKAILSFNKKKDEWGWKSIEIYST